MEEKADDIKKLNPHLPSGQVRKIMPKIENKNISKFFINNEATKETV